MSSPSISANHRLSLFLSHISSSSPAAGTSRFDYSGTQPTKKMSGDDKKKETIVIVGTGWAGWTLSQEINDKTYNIVVISPDRTVTLSPLLASAACGIFDFRIAEEPVRRRSRKLEKVQAEATDVDFDKQVVLCKSAITNFPEQSFEIKYDYLILAPGCGPNTFGTPGVLENALMLKSVKDAQAIRARILDIFEIASLPTLSEEERRNILHITIVGGGPTGVALAAEVDDMIRDHLYTIYPATVGLATMAIHDVAPQILAPFDQKLSEYALASFKKRHIEIKTGSHITRIEKDALFTKEDGRIPSGLIVWATGNKEVPLVDKLECKKSEKLPRILTDRQLRVLRPDSTPFENVFALGDAADIESTPLPTTAEVAVQKAHHLANCFNSTNSDEERTFKYENRALMTYIGNHDGLVDGKTEWTGASAWLAWRSGSLEWTRSWRRKLMIYMYWAMNWLDGREISRK
jgi:NADH:ubiquinone reductase (non-electrogenic)